MFGGGERVVPLRLHSRLFWLLLVVPVPGRRDLRFVLDSGTVISAVKETVLTELLATGRATQLGRRRYLLHEVTVAGVALPDMPVRVGGRTEEIDADGLIGLDYLAQFERVCVDIPSLRLTLTFPSIA